MKPPLCVICQQNNAEKVNLFTQTTLNKFKNVSEIRQKFNLKYSAVILPLEVSPDKGYHRLCYSNFTSLKKNIKSICQRVMWNLLLHQVFLIDNFQNLNVLIYFYYK